MTTKTKPKPPAVTQATMIEQQVDRGPGRCPGCGSILVATHSGTVCFEASLGRCDKTAIMDKIDPKLIEQLHYQDRLKKLPKANYVVEKDDRGKVRKGYLIEGQGAQLWRDVRNGKVAVLHKGRLAEGEVLAVIGQSKPRIFEPVES